MEVTEESPIVYCYALFFETHKESMEYLANTSDSELLRHSLHKLCDDQKLYRQQKYSMFKIVSCFKAMPTIEERIFLIGKPGLKHLTGVRLQGYAIVSGIWGAKEINFINSRVRPSLK